MYKLFITFFIFLILEKIIIKYFINDDIKNKLYLDITEKKASSFLIGLDFIIVPALILIFEQRYMQNILLLYFVIMSLIIGCFMIIRNNVYNKKINDRIIFGNDYYYIDFVFKSSFLNMITFIIYSNIINDNPLFMFLNIVYIIGSVRNTVHNIKYLIIYQLVVIQILVRLNLFFPSKFYNSNVNDLFSFYDLLLYPYDNVSLTLQDRLL